MPSVSKILFLILLVFVAYLVILQIRLPSCLKVPAVPMLLSQMLFKPIVKIYDLSPTDSHLHIVKSVFSKLGYHIVGMNATSWDVLWSHPYPFYSIRKAMTDLKPHQKVNHFPGSGFLTKKSNLVSLNIEHVPKAFVMPEQKDSFLSYIRKHKSKLWVQKSNTHRGIKVVEVTDLDLNQNGSFIQEFIDRPLLIDDRKFDIGVYVIQTSVDPLRVYIYSGDVLLRFCREKYYPFNSLNVDSYVVGDDYVPVWEIPELKRFYSDMNYSAKEALNAYLLSKKASPKKLWSRIADVIRTMYQESESNMIEAAFKLGNIRNFFELIRVDFVVDEDMNVFVLEANMSPNLSAEHFPPNRLLYEQVLFNTLSIVGLIRKFPDTVSHRSLQMEVSDKDTAVFIEECNSQACNSSCKISKCKVCTPCMTSELSAMARTAYVEHMNRNKFRRVVPAPLDSKTTVIPSELSEMNHFMERWYKGKCLQDVAFCY